MAISNIIQLKSLVLTTYCCTWLLVILVGGKPWEFCDEVQL